MHCSPSYAFGIAGDVAAFVVGDAVLVKNPFERTTIAEAMGMVRASQYRPLL
jgi:hypothetical protein